MGIVLTLRGCLGVEHCNCHTWDRDQARPGPEVAWKGRFAEDFVLEQGEVGYSPVSPAVERGVHIFGSLVSISIDEEGSGCSAGKGWMQERMGQIAAPLNGVCWGSRNGAAAPGHPV